MAIHLNSQQPVAAVVKEDFLRLHAALQRAARELRELRMGAQGAEPGMMLQNLVAEVSFLQSPRYRF